MRISSHIVPVVSYDDFLRQFYWDQDQHITLIGTTGCGKTTLENDLVTMRDYVIFLSTKPLDETQEELGPLGFRIARNSDEISLDIAHKWVVSPIVRKRRGRTVSADEIKSHHREIFRETIMYAYHQTVWSVIVDEGRYICDFLRLRDEVTLLYLQGRSGGNSIVMGTQRPRWVPLESFDAATHLFFWHDNDAGNIQRIGQLAGMNTKEAIAVVENLPMTEHQGGHFLYYNTRTGQMLISKVEL
jgi:hypothetical protein